MSTLVPVGPVATVTQFAQYLLSGGYMKTPVEYLNEEEVQSAIQTAAITTASKFEANSEVNMPDICDILGMGDQLKVVHTVRGNNWDAIMGNLTLACSKHPAACVVSFGDTAVCIAGYDGNTTGDESRFVSLVSNAMQMDIPRSSTVDSEYDLLLPTMSAPCHAIIIESTVFSRPMGKGKQEEGDPPPQIHVKIESTPQEDAPQEEEEEEEIIPMEEEVEEVEVKKSPQLTKKRKTRKVLTLDSPPVTKRTTRARKKKK